MSDDATVGTETMTTEGESILEIRSLDAGYGDLQILSDVDLDVDDGEYVTIVGPNGAGKSTVMKSVFGLTTHMGGTVTFDDEEIQDHSPERIIRTGIGFVPQTDNVFGGLTVRENLEMGAYILEATPADLAEQYPRTAGQLSQSSLESLCRWVPLHRVLGDSVPQDRIDTIYDRFPILEERKHQKAGTLSGGQRQMVAMGRALMLDPDLLLLDEPSAGLAPDLVEDMFDRIDRINDAGTAILMVEQNAKEALRRCDRGYVLVDGQNRYMDSGDALLADDQVRQDFLGG
ncbi:ABC-type transport system ATP-binding protein (probable substrate branched-chain amino acids) [Natronomonas pharaonis DSM 2160]|uniref:ABC-type transport system ATP-binding protein (Probable substrate branched-chain amino acids) n=1 Tax=Natronomonas pharaonis (strain ATCC 35678 / DSM 2160 / CIP 103997 / JCM 8858 / NBRC 14720 / NCIMB 2260 / Gabara) TaxID=348780 RepID=A0A1U7EY64_NATPD|nr:ABC transporter ATP-binding protein [Natronomonas pharaonis]CAI50160.1 ABC-type transport system ATP-binding protein (probable substrate branched-chain amino acids) [Natronomonas pharaonis DSM 2160]